MKRLFLLMSFLFLCVNILNAQHLKKDGTPDMRYKENKVNYSPSPYSAPSYSVPSNSSEIHLKKDGTPDMRFKENKSNYSSTSTVPVSTPVEKTHLQYYTKEAPYVSRYKRQATSVTSIPHYSSKSNYSYTVNRNSDGRIVRSEAAKNTFKKETGYPRGRPGYVIDHIVPLKKGGCDCPRNMQWQTISEAKAKDRWE